MLTLCHTWDPTAGSGRSIGGFCSDSGVGGFGSDCGASGFCRDSGVRDLGGDSGVADFGGDVVHGDIDLLGDFRSGRQVGGFGSDAFTGVACLEFSSSSSDEVNTVFL